MPLSSVKSLGSGIDVIVDEDEFVESAVADGEINLGLAQASKTTNEIRMDLFNWILINISVYFLFHRSQL